MVGAALALALAESACRPPAKEREIANTSDDAAVPKHETGPCPSALLAARAASDSSLFHPSPTHVERRRMRDVVRGLLSKQVDGVAVSDLADSIGYEIAQARDPSEAVVLRKIGAGGGAHLVRLGSESSVLIEVSDAQLDAQALSLACELFRRDEARALSIASGAQSGESLSMFHTVTRALAQAVPSATVVQLRVTRAVPGPG
jgi:hypothetical protein